MSYDNDPSFDLRDIIVLLSKEIPEDPRRDIMEIAPPLPQIFVFDGFEGCVQLLQSDVKGPLGIHLPLSDGLDGVLNEHLVIQDHEINIKDE